MDPDFDDRFMTSNSRLNPTRKLVLPINLPPPFNLSLTIPIPCHTIYFIIHFL